ncbi:MAG: hypothetical protein ABIQ60_13390 [Burkholderiaceae bacterium]
MPEVKRSLRDLKPRPRVLSASCLGLCPKAAMAVALVGRDAKPRWRTITDVAQVASAVRLLVSPDPA